MNIYVSIFANQLKNFVFVTKKSCGLLVQVKGQARNCTLFPHLRKFFAIAFTEKYVKYKQMKDRPIIIYKTKQPIQAMKLLATQQLCQKIGYSNFSFI